MATTLGFVMTDAVIPQALLRRMLVAARSSATTASRWMAILRPTTRCCCWRTARPAFGPIRRKCRVFEEALDEMLEIAGAQIARDGEGAQQADHHRGARRAQRCRGARALRARSPIRRW